MAIRELLAEKDDTEQATIKGVEIAKLDFVGEFTDKATEITVEIMNYVGIEKGIELFARAWKDGKQFGFGDGTIETERFRFFNPPILVNDDNGDIVIEGIDIKGEKTVRKLREDPVEAIRQSLAHTIKVSGIDSDTIEVGSIGNTTDTFYPGAAGDPLSAFFFRTATETFATIRAGAGTGTSSVADGQSVYLDATAVLFADMGRSIEGFDTSSIPDAAVISSGSFSYYGSNAANTDFAQSMVIDRNIPASSGSPANADYNLAEWDSVAQSDTRIADTAWTNGGYNDFPLNATGIGNISTTGITWLGTRGSSDFDNSAPTFVVNGISNFPCFHAAQAGTSTDPKLVVTYTSGAATTNFLSTLGVGT